MPVIEVSHLTKDYGHGRGVFDVSIKVEQGIGQAGLEGRVYLVLRSFSQSKGSRGNRIRNRRAQQNSVVHVLQGWILMFARGVWIDKLVLSNRAIRRKQRIGRRQRLCQIT